MWTLGLKGLKVSQSQTCNKFRLETRKDPTVIVDPQHQHKDNGKKVTVIFTEPKKANKMRFKLRKGGNKESIPKDTLHYVFMVIFCQNKA